VRSAVRRFDEARSREVPGDGEAVLRLRAVNLVRTRPTGSR
jgi:hypothetical protein